MGRKFKFAAAALLGFSAACSSAKHAAGRASEPQETIGVEVRSDTTHYRVIAMYGVPSPRGKAVVLRPEEVVPADSTRTEGSVPAHPTAE